jgi:hypothetical protein
MKSTRSFLTLAAPVAVILLLAACAAGMDHGHMSQSSPPSSQDMAAMCDMHKQMMAGKSDAERRTTMDEHMKTPEMRQHMQMMQEQCK